MEVQKMSLFNKIFKRKSPEDSIFQRKPSGGLRIEDDKTSIGMVKFLASDNLDELQALVEDTPGLLLPEADEFLKEISDRMPKNYMHDLLGTSDDDRIKDVITNERKRALLARCRQVGIEKAFSEARKQNKG
jgi:hypothetical protein